MTGPDDAATSVDAAAAGGVSADTRAGATRRLADREPSAPYVSPRSLARTLRIALFIVAAAGVLAALAALERYRFAADALSIGAVTPGREDVVSQHRTITDILLVASIGAAAISWLAWFARAYGNLQALGAAWTRLSKETAVFCCAVPVFNLFFAPWLVNEAWQTSDPDGGPRPLPGEGRPPALILVWPLVALAGIVTAVLGEKVSHRDLEYLGRVRSGSRLEILAALLLSTAALVTALVSDSLTARQAARAARVEVAA